MEMENKFPRRVRKRKQQGFSYSTEARGAVSENHDDESFEDLNEEVKQRSALLPNNASEFSPKSRLEDVQKRTRGSQYEREYRLQLLHRMLMRRIPLDQIAKELEVSVTTVMNDRKEIYHRLREEAKRLDINHIVGDTLGFYTEIQGMALRAASNSQSPLSSRLAALRTALSAKNDMHRFLQTAGVYDVLQFRAAEGTSKDDISTLMKITKGILEDSDKELDKAKLGLPEFENFSFNEEDDVKVL